MRLTALAEQVSMRSAEGDPEFRESIARVGLLSLRTVGALELAVPLLMLAAGIAVIPVPASSGRAWISNLMVAAVGAVSLAIGWSPPGRRWPRLFTGLSTFVSVVVVVWSALLLAPEVQWIEHYLIGYTVLVMFGGAAAVPFTAPHMLALGLSLSALLPGSIAAVRDTPAGQASDFGLLQYAFLFPVSLLCAAMTASVYANRYRNFMAHQNALKASEQLREAQNRLLISDNAAVMGRVAAALSHELNSPIGVLTSAVETMSTIAARMATAGPAEQERLRAVLQDVHASARGSTMRLREIVSRIQRFTNLDRAEFQSANINDLLSDVVALAAPEHRASDKVVVDFGTIPRFPCRPQQMSAVFSNLLSNALDALGPAGRVRVFTREVDSRIEVGFEDNGKGIAPDQIAALFDPAAFRVSEGRVKAGNWSLFSCRQIVREHGGDIRLESGDFGTTVTVQLPVHAGPAASSDT